jgi:hypothetical protein
VEFDEAGYGRSLSIDGAPRPGHIGGALQSVSKAGNPIEAEKISPFALRRNRE